MEIGSKFGHLTAIKEMGVSKNCAVTWLYRCDCGNEREIEARVVTAGRIRTCGKCSLKHKLRSDSRGKEIRIGRALRTLYTRYIRKATTDRRQWHLTIQEFIGIVTRSCTICGQAPSTTMRGTRSTTNFPILLSINNHYTVDNTGTCCKRCNEKYGKVGISQAIEEIYREYHHLTKR